jgi:hypothetical protein
MSRNGTSAIYESTCYLGIVYAKLVTEWKICEVSTYLWSYANYCANGLQQLASEVWGPC